MKKHSSDFGYVLERFVIVGNEKNNITKKPKEFISDLIKDSNVVSLLENLMMRP